MATLRYCVTAQLLLLSLSIALSTATADSSSSSVTRDAATCRTLGFDSETLDCRRCDELTTFLTKQREATGGSDEQQQAAIDIDTDCRACCSDLSALHLAGASGAKYARAELEVCTCKFGRYPKVANFVQQHAAKHAQLTIKYMNARHPFLVFYDADGLKKEEVSIARWDEDAITEFLAAKLTPALSSDQVTDDDATAQHAASDEL